MQGCTVSQRLPIRNGIPAKSRICRRDNKLNTFDSKTTRIFADATKVHRQILAHASLQRWATLSLIRVHEVVTCTATFRSEPPVFAISSRNRCNQGTPTRVLVCLPAESVHNWSHEAIASCSLLPI